MAVPSADTDELARFGYKQELDRSLGLFPRSPPGSLRGRPVTVLAEHRAGTAPAAIRAVGEKA